MGADVSEKRAAFTLVLFILKHKFGVYTAKWDLQCAWSQSNGSSPFAELWYLYTRRQIQEECNIHRYLLQNFNFHRPLT